ncbi:MAG: NADP-dependent oxidoreductase [Gammaproteobacteria bacterium]
MKAIRVHNHGDAEEMEMEDVQQPKPARGQVLVKVHDAAVNPVDWKIREGYMKGSLPGSFPYTMGQDFSGEVVETGKDVTGLQRGDRVFGFAQGTYAEYALASPDELARVPRSVDWVGAAAIPTAGLTAWQIVMDVAKLSNNQAVLIHGAGGGVGSFAVQFAKKVGARVIATASRDVFSYLQSLGADQLIDYKSERFENRVKDVDTVIDLVGGDALARSYGIVRKNGLVVTTVGPADEAAARKHGIRVTQFLMRRRGDELEQISRFMEVGSVNPHISKILPLSEAKAAENICQFGHPHGKVILHVG